MAVATAPRRPGRVSRGRALTARAGKSGRAFGARLVRPHQAALANLTRIPLTVAGFGCADGAAWWWHPIVGLVCAAPLLIVLELMIADER